MAGIDFLIANALGMDPKAFKKMVTEAPEHINEALKLMRDTASNFNRELAEIKSRLSAIENILRVPVAVPLAENGEENGQRGTERVAAE